MKMIKTYTEIENEDYILCLPQKGKVDMGMLGTYECLLKVCNNTITLKAIPAKLFLSKGWLAVDDNGVLITTLDSDIDKKLVIIENLSLFLAIRQTQELEKLWIDIVDEIPRRNVWSFY